MSNLYRASERSAADEDSLPTMNPLAHSNHRDQEDLDQAIGELGTEVDDISVAGGAADDTPLVVGNDIQDESMIPDEAVQGQDEPHYVYEQQQVPSVEPEDPAHTSDDHQGETAFEGVLAQDPQQVRDQMLQNAVEAKDVRVFDETGGKRLKRWIPVTIVVVVLIVLVAVGVSLGVVIPRRNASSGMTVPTVSPSEAPSSAPSQAPTTGPFAIVSQAVEAAFGVTPEDSTSPQYRAALWMAEEDQLVSSPLDDARFAQRYAMAVFYYSTGGDTSWNLQANFLSPTLEICDWKQDAPEGAVTVLGILGVECFGGQEVIAIEFIQNNLTGTIPDELGALPVLTALILNQNALFGTVPTSIFNSNFQYLSLPFNNISGTLPTEMGRFGTLIQVWFQESSLTGTIPTELGANTGLQALTIRASLNGTIPETLLNLSELLYLDLGVNNLTGALPQEFPTRWPKLQQATFTGNAFTGAMPNDIGLLSELQSLAISETNITGTIPESLMNLTALQQMNLEKNNLTGSLPRDWSRLSLVWLLSLQDNQLTGPLPSSFGILTNMLTVTFAGNRFNSTIPPELGNMTNILNILFQENEFTGTVPRTFLQWGALQRLTLDRNDLAGDISFLCDPTDETEPWLDSILNIHADCLAGEITCPCCGFCCSADGTCESK